MGTIKEYYFATVKKIVRPAIISLNIYVRKHETSNKYQIDVTGYSSTPYMRDAGLNPFEANRFDTEEEAKGAAKRVAAIAKAAGYFQTAEKISTFDMNSLMPYRNMPGVKELMIYNIEAE